MTEILEVLRTALVVAALPAGLATLVRFARGDVFAAPGTGYRPSDELGPFCSRRRPA